jgi:hypothetical protein
MNLKNAAILLFACSIVGMSGEVLNYFDRIVQLRIDTWVFVIICILVDVAFLLVANGYKAGEERRERHRSAGLFLTVVASCWTLYSVWRVIERSYNGEGSGLPVYYFLWAFVILSYCGSNLFLGIAIVSGNLPRIRVAGLVTCIGATIWIGWLLFRFLLIYGNQLNETGRGFRIVAELMDFALPVGIAFFGLALYRTPVSGLRNDSVIDEL